MDRQFRLPPFSSLTAFEAAARHGSFTLAARELNVSQPAISRRIAVLEADLGTPMFARDIRPLKLTPSGKRLLETFQASMGVLEDEIQKLRNTHTGNAITIGASSCFASFWLLPRWPKLQAAFPHHSLRLLTGDIVNEAEKLDIRIEFSAKRREHVGRILEEKVFCVSSPAYLQGRTHMYSLAEISKQHLISLDDKQNRWYSWKTWFAELGQDVEEEKLKTTYLDDYSLVIDAVLVGQGLALGWDGLLDPLLRSGALVRVSEEMVQSPRGYHVLCTNTEQKITHDICEWMIKASGMPS